MGGGRISIGPAKIDTPSLDQMTGQQSDGGVTKLISDNNNQKRAQTYADTLKDQDIDQITKDQLVNLYTNGAPSTELAKILADAQAGKGIYAVRKTNEVQAAMMRAMPGRAQLLSSLSPGGSASVA